MNVTYSQNHIRSETVTINGKQIYFEVYGNGEPLILLHGYGLSSKSWRPFYSDFKDEYTIYSIDLPGHGNSEPFKEDLSLKSVAEDLNSLLTYLNLIKLKAIGFSFGGDVLFQLALINPLLIESMITIGAVGSWSVHHFPRLLHEFTYNNRDKFPWLQASQSNDRQVEILMHQFKKYTVYLNDLELQQVKPEILIMAGDDDEGMDWYEVARAKQYLPSSDIWILPNVSHNAHTGPNKVEFVVQAKKFFSKGR